MPQTVTSGRTQAERVRAMRTRLIDATVVSLDSHGFAATSISVVQQEAGVSRGALMHHFGSRNDLMVATAQHLLDAALRPRREARRWDDVGALIRYYWQRIVNTREGRAFIEILIACRTDPDLQNALGSTFQDWEQEISDASAEMFVAANTSPNDVAILWSIARAFLRGLIVHGQFIDDPDHLDHMINRFSDLLSGALTLKS